MPHCVPQTSCGNVPQNPRSCSCPRRSRSARFAHRCARNSRAPFSAELEIVAAARAARVTCVRRAPDTRRSGGRGGDLVADGEGRRGAPRPVARGGHRARQPLGQAPRPRPDRHQDVPRRSRARARQPRRVSRQKEGQTAALLPFPVPQRGRHPREARGGARVPPRLPADQPAGDDRQPGLERRGAVREARAGDDRALSREHARGGAPLRAGQRSALRAPRRAADLAPARQCGGGLGVGRAVHLAEVERPRVRHHRSGAGRSCLSDGAGVRGRQRLVAVAADHGSEEDRARLWRGEGAARDRRRGRGTGAICPRSARSTPRTFPSSRRAV